MNQQVETFNALFANRRLVIATKHKKEKVIGPLIEPALAVKCFVPENLDTDSLGSFSGNIPRLENAIATARKKCFMAMELTNSDMAIASEGSFGGHPHLFFSNANDEFVVFIDKKNGLEIFARELSTSTNFNAAAIQKEKELKAFAHEALFPSHGLILRKEKGDHTHIYKGIKNWTDLKQIFFQLTKEFGSCYIETDMRAMMNPTRMEVISVATNRLIEKIKSCCPECSTPGFSITNSKAGLPCNQCGLPTQSILYHIQKCTKCEHSEELKYPYKKETEDPTYCDFCNP